MKIAIYNEPSDSGIGGGEYSVAVLAEALAKEHEVEILHHRRSLTAEQLTELFTVDLSRVRLRYLKYDPDRRTNGHNPLTAYREAKNWHSKLSKSYDIFVNFGHWVPPFCHSKVGVLMVLFPIFDRAYVWPWKLEHWDDSSVFWKCLRLLYDEWEWRRRVRSYRVILANSQFTKNWARFRWGVDCKVLYPPVDDHFISCDKLDMILSVGRFVASGQKSQLEMVKTFSRIVEDRPRGWKFFSVGGLGEDPKDRAYFEYVRQLGRGRETHVKANVERAKLQNLYAQSKIYWHAAGYNVDEETCPQMQEHFGISTVESMAAGCVPVAINRAGQREIVEHGISGFLWNTLDELREYTIQLMSDDDLRTQMSIAARARSRLFSRRMFIEQFQNILRTLT